MIKRVLSGVLGAVAAGNGLHMLIAGAHWYENTLGVSDTGPFNPHFVADIGAAFLVGGAAMIARGLNPSYWPAALTAAAFFAAHGLIHVAGIFAGHTHHAGFEWAAVVIPAALALWTALPTKEEYHA